jgi:hypothetical protein
MRSPPSGHGAGAKLCLREFRKSLSADGRNDDDS